MTPITRNPQWYETQRRKQRETLAKCVQKKICKATDDHPVGKIIARVVRIALECDTRKY